MKGNIQKSSIVLVAVVSVIATLFISSLSFAIAYAVKKNNEFNTWYEALTPAEKEAYQQEQADKREAMRIRHEITSVSQYIGTQTNHYGGVTDTYTAYTFTYLDGSKLCHVEDFRHYDYGMTKVIIGDKDEYVIDNYDHVQYLVLTKETLAGLKVVQ